MPYINNIADLKAYNSYANRFRLAYILLSVLMLFAIILTLSIDENHINYQLVMIWKLARLAVLAIYVIIIISAYQVTKKYLAKGICLSRALFSLTGIGIIFFLFRPLPKANLASTKEIFDNKPIKKRGSISSFLYVSLVVIITSFAASIIITGGFAASIFKHRVMTQYDISQPPNTPADCMITSVINKTTSWTSYFYNALYITYKLPSDQKIESWAIDAGIKCVELFPDQEYDTQKVEDFYDFLDGIS